MKGIFAYDGPYMQTIQKALNFLHLNLLVLLFPCPWLQQARQLRQLSAL